MTNEQVAAIAAWTLEDIQNDPLAAVEQVRQLAASHLALQRERDAAVADIELLPVVGSACTICRNRPESGKYSDCPHSSVDCVYDGHTYSRAFEWRGPKPEQVLAPADQSAGEYADNPVPAQA